MKKTPCTPLHDTKISQSVIDHKDDQDEKDNADVVSDDGEEIPGKAKPAKKPK